MRLGAIFVAFCMVLIAASAGAVLYLTFGFNLTESSALAAGTLMALVLYNVVASRMSVRSVVGTQLTDLSRGGADLARQVAEIGRRLAAVESKVESAYDRARGAAEPLAVEISELGALVKQLAETVATHETRLADTTRPGSLPRPAAAALPPIAPSAIPLSVPPVLAVFPELAQPAFASSSLPPQAAAPAAPESSPGDRLAAIRGAVDANRIDLYLQPIVTLPQRKVRYYEAMSRLRTEKGELMPAADFIAPAEAAALMPKIDNLVVFRCVQVVRRLLLKNREIGVFCNMSGSTLTDASVFPQLLEFLEANRAIASSLVLEFTQTAMRVTGPIENESLAALAERGFRFSLDNVTDLRLEPKELASRGFRFIKVPSNLLLNRSGEAATDIHPADLSDLVGRFGIDLIAEKIESEGSVVDLLDYDVRFGQGFLFSPPRPVRAEALQGIAERSDIVDTAAPAGSAANGSQRTTGLAQLARRI